MNEHIRVSKDDPHRGVGKQLFFLTAAQAKKSNVHKLSICAGSSEETVTFYRALGSVSAMEVNPVLYESDPVIFIWSIRFDLSLSFFYALVFVSIAVGEAGLPHYSERKQSIVKHTIVCFYHIPLPCICQPHCGNLLDFSHFIYYIIHSSKL